MTHSFFHCSCVLVYFIDFTNSLVRSVFSWNKDRYALQNIKSKMKCYLSWDYLPMLKASPIELNWGRKCVDDLAVVYVLSSTSLYFDKSELWADDQTDSIYSQKLNMHTAYTNCSYLSLKNSCNNFIHQYKTVCASTYSCIH